MSHRQIPVASAQTLAPGQRKLVFVEGRGIVLFNLDGVFCAIDNTCPHQGASLASGKLDGSVLHCPAHGLRFDLATGCMPGTGGLCLKMFPVHTVDGKLVLEIADTPY